MSRSRGRRRIASARVFLGALLLLAGARAHAAAQQDPPAAARAPASVNPETLPRPSLTAIRVDQPITLDGRLDEPAWSSAPAATSFIQTFPETGVPATQDTEVRVLYDADQLYIGAMLYETEPEGMIRKG